MCHCLESILGLIVTLKVKTVGADLDQDDGTEVEDIKLLNAYRAFPCSFTAKIFLEDAVGSQAVYNNLERQFSLSCTEGNIPCFHPTRSSLFIAATLT